MLHGSKSYVLSTPDGQIAHAHSISAGLDYPGVGPEHAYWKETGAVTYVSRTDDFAAVNAYYHCDRFFRMVQDTGFNIASYFNGTSFPVPVDHHALGNVINAQCRGKSRGDSESECPGGDDQDGDRGSGMFEAKPTASGPSQPRDMAIVAEAAATRPWRWSGR